ncbi:MAG: protein-export chaperone SecB [Defluviicoccus sp.]|nr:protein-export chaperone SecB [Defluviicoccus sp.]MDE0277394.1 protein-export chaperone SecB [Defluviicoccus sp.]
MADDSVEPQQRENGSAAADRPMLAIGAQYIKDLSFENPLGPEGLAKLTENPKVEVEVNTSARLLAESAYEVSLFIRAEAQSGDATAFIVELTYGGIVIVGDVAEEDIQPLVLIEGPRHLFPFARSVVANVTRDGGFPPMMIDPIDFAALYMENDAARAGFDIS